MLRNDLIVVRKNIHFQFLMVQAIFVIFSFVTQYTNPESNKNTLMVFNSLISLGTIIFLKKNNILKNNHKKMKKKENILLNFKFNFFPGKNKLFSTI